MSCIIVMEKLTLSTGLNRSEDALIVSEALSAQIERLRDALDHRSLFSAAYNRKLVRRIEVLDTVRAEFLVLSRELLTAESEIVGNCSSP